MLRQRKTCSLYDLPSQCHPYMGPHERLSKSPVSAGCLSEKTGRLLSRWQPQNTTWGLCKFGGGRITSCFNVHSNRSVPMWHGYKNSSQPHYQNLPLIKVISHNVTSVEKIFKVLVLKWPTTWLSHLWRPSAEVPPLGATAFGSQMGASVDRDCPAVVLLSWNTLPTSMYNFYCLFDPRSFCLF